MENKPPFVVVFSWKKKNNTGLEWHRKECELWQLLGEVVVAMIYFDPHMTRSHIIFFVNFSLSTFTSVFGGYKCLSSPTCNFLLFASVGHYYPGHWAVLPSVSAEVFPGWRDGYCWQGLGWITRQTLVLQVQLQDIPYLFVKLQPNPSSHLPELWAFIFHAIGWTRSSGPIGIKIWGS